MPVHRQAVNSATQVCREGSLQPFETDRKEQKEGHNKTQNNKTSGTRLKGISKHTHPISHAKPVLKRGDNQIFGTVQYPCHPCRKPYKKWQRYEGCNYVDPLRHGLHNNPMRRQCQFTVKRPKKGRFNCCPRTTTLRRSGGGVGWFSCHHF